MKTIELANRIADNIVTQAKTDYPMLEKMVPATKLKEVRNKLYDLIFKELSVAEVSKDI